MIYRQSPTPTGLCEIVQQKHLSYTHGAVRYFSFLANGPGKVRKFVEELGNSVEKPFLDNRQDVNAWLKTMDSLFDNLPINRSATETIVWIARRFIALGLTEAVAREAMVHGEDIRREVMGIVSREGTVKKRVPTQSAGMSGGPGFSYQPNPKPNPNSQKQKP